MSDGSANGWNNIAGARKYETLIERFFANEELHTVFFHDHLFANSHQQHGMFGALLVEPAGSVFLNPKNGRPLNSGANAVIKTANGKSYREFALFVHDFALLFDQDGKPLNPPEHPGSDDDPGVMEISYRCEPMRERLNNKNDPSHIFSSRKYGDPATPLLQAYTGERVIIRYLMPADKPKNISFLLHGHNWLAQPDDPFSARISVQGAVSVGGVYNIELENGASAYPGDYLYCSGSLKWDVESGMWGIFRVMKKGIRYCCECAYRSFNI